MLSLPFVSSVVRQALFSNSICCLSPPHTTAMIATCMMLTLIHRRHRFDHYKEIENYYYEQIGLAFHLFHLPLLTLCSNFRYVVFQQPASFHYRFAFCCGYYKCCTVIRCCSAAAHF